MKKFRPIHTEKNQLSFRTRPAVYSSDFTVVDGDNLSVFISRHAIDVMLKWSADGGSSEVIGRLLGRGYRDANGIWTVVDIATCARSAHSSRTSVHATIEDELSVVQAMDVNLVHERTGWWHSHPYLGLPSYSGVDRSNQAIVCPESHQVGILVVVERHGVELFVFAGPQSSLIGRFEGSLSPIPRVTAESIGSSSTPVPASTEVTETTKTWPLSPLSDCDETVSWFRQHREILTFSGMISILLLLFYVVEILPTTNFGRFMKSSQRENNAREYIRMSGYDGADQKDTSDVLIQRDGRAVERGVESNQARQPPNMVVPFQDNVSHVSGTPRKRVKRDNALTNDGKKPLVSIPRSILH
jgi:hypothetical protein